MLIKDRQRVSGGAHCIQVHHFPIMMVVKVHYAYYERLDFSLFDCVFVDSKD